MRVRAFRVRFEPEKRAGDFGAATAGAAEGDAPAQTEPGRPVRGRLVVEVRDDAAREALEATLEPFAKRWKLRRALTHEAGASLLHYNVRLRRSASVNALTAELASNAGVGPVTFMPRGPAA